nr:hypothetical protein [uncultured bacterium]
MGLFGPRANRHIFSDFLSLISLYDTGKVLVDTADRRCVELLNQAQDTMNKHKEEYERAASKRLFEQIFEWRSSVLKR